MFSFSYPCSFQTTVTESGQNYAWPTDFICHVYLFFQFASHLQKLVQLPAFSCHLTCHSIFITIDFFEVTPCGWRVTNPVTKLFHRGDIWQWFFFPAPFQIGSRRHDYIDMILSQFSDCKAFLNVWGTPWNFPQKWTITSDQALLNIKTQS